MCHKHQRDSPRHGTHGLELVEEVERVRAHGRMLRVAVENNTAGGHGEKEEGGRSVAVGHARHGGVEKLANLRGVKRAV